MPNNFATSKGAHKIAHLLGMVGEQMTTLAGIAKFGDTPSPAEDDFVIALQDKLSEAIGPCPETTAGGVLRHFLQTIRTIAATIENEIQ